ncbi:MipA/OmpV family protein [Vibrio nigripulchritudo]|uniref:MipA/OmpV family protein n=1 Tax=Vibrio nigripulchritudo TaxID=28173 RepID=UPI002493020F|nr:MipA/OmpV family protein [Vibrio nigripulchritudo]BDU37002.1 MltA-interacting MipA family protein [Vibrio nigripulchritudo]
MRALIHLTPLATLMGAMTFTATASEVNKVKEQEWGVGMAYRNASIVYNLPGEDDASVSTFTPLFYYKGESVFLDGLEGGVHLYKQDDYKINALTRLRFVDLPASQQNRYGGHSFDLGFQYRHFFQDSDWYIDAEIMSDDAARLFGNLRATAKSSTENWDFKPSAELRVKSNDFNSYYYGANGLEGSPGFGKNIGGGVEFKVGFETRYRVTSNLYLLGSAYATRLDDNAYDNIVVKERWGHEYFIGFGLFNDKNTPTRSDIKTRPYLRVAQGFATPSDMGDIFQFKGVPDENGNKMTSFFYGHPLTDELFGAPIDIYLTPGAAWHWSSSTQSASPEYVIAVKAYYTFEWPFRWKFGAAEGISYVQNITYIESSELEGKYENMSNLMNYLDISFDFNIGDMVGKPEWDHLWVGYGLHHRSSIFEKASQFGRIKGGSNYNTIYLQYDF